MFLTQSVLLLVVLMCCRLGIQTDELKPSENILKPGKICLTQVCNDTASEILKNMDVTVDPCDDFYQFACGGWIESTEIRDGYWDFGIINQKNEIVMNQLKMSLNETIKEDEPRPLKMVKAYFKSCMDESEIEKNSVDSLLQVMKSVGGWPLIEGDKWNETEFDWIECITELQKMGYFIDNMPQVYVYSDSKNETQRTVYLRRDQSNFVFHSYADNGTKDILREDLVNITVELGANRTFAEKEVRELFDFVSELYDLDQNNGSSDPDLFQCSKFQQINEKYIEKLILPFSKIENDNEVFRSSSIDNLKILMEKTSKRVQANYIVWSAISKSVDFLNKDIREKYQKLLNDGALRDFRRTKSSRTEECIEKAKQSMIVSLSALYIRNHFDRNMKNDTIKIIENIREQIVKNLEGSTRMSSKVKNLFRRKIEKIATFIAYDRDVFNDTELEELDKNLNISSSDDYLHNNINIMRYMMEKTFTKLQKPIEKFDTLDPSWYHLEDKIEWMNFDMTDLYHFSWDALFDRGSNAAIIPAAYLQGIMNKIDNPEYIKYGATGFSLGHELYHAIDNIGRMANEDNENIHWDNSSEEIFQQQDECFINQYGNYSLGGRKLDGRKLLRENFADYGGIKAAYMAYSDWASKQDEPESLLPNLPYTQKQLFWISAVNNFCSKRRDPNSYNTEDYHTPHRIRFLGAFSNMPEFAEDFSCSVGSKMNPVNRCFI